MKCTTCKTGWIHWSRGIEWQVPRCQGATGKAIQHMSAALSRFLPDIPTSSQVGHVVSQDQRCVQKRFEARIQMLAHAWLSCMIHAVICQPCSYIHCLMNYMVPGYPKCDGSWRIPGLTRVELQTFPFPILLRLEFAVPKFHVNLHNLPTINP